MSDYLRQTLELAPAQRLYARLRNLARLPLYLWMFKEVSGSGDLPADRGGLLRSFVCAPRLLGNVFEWTASRYKAYPYVPDDGRENLDEEGLRVMRGGSWYTGQGRVRCGYRFWNFTRLRNDLGYRLARGLSR